MDGKFDSKKVLIGEYNEIMQRRAPIGTEIKCKR